MVNRISAFIYGLVCYVVFFGTFLYAVGFLGNFWVPKSIDSGRETSFAHALAINFALLGVFALQHSIMARPWFKKIWTKIVSTTVERSTYVLFSSLALLLLFWKWEPMGGVIWSVENRTGQLVLKGLFALGWLIILVATFLINHFDLFGLRQIWLNLIGRPYTPLVFGTPGPYKVVRHPLYVGWLLTFWAAPVMTGAHFVFTIVTTLYILVAIQLEERDLMRAHPEYAEYRRSVSMLVPRIFRKESKRKNTRGPGAEEAWGHWL